MSRSPTASSGYDAERHGPRRVVGAGFHEQVWNVVRRVPPGHVTTFGDIAGELGLRSVARQVGWALAALPRALDDDVPWHRVVNARGQLAMRKDGAPSEDQVQRLLEDGVAVTEEGRVEAFRDRRYDFEAPGT